MSSDFRLPPSALRPWRQVVTPHADIRQGKFDSSVFAADLGEVLAGRGAVDYRDAKTFFSKTYLTQGLTQLVIDVLRRLNGTGKATKRQLTEEQLKDLAGRLKEAEARLPAALTTVYRLVLVPAKNKTLRCFDLGIGGDIRKTTLSNRVSDRLIDEQQILDKLDPAILIGDRFGLWPEDRKVINVKTLADYFTQLTHLPRLASASVLPDCLSKGVHRALFAYALGDREKKQFDTICFIIDPLAREGAEVRCDVVIIAKGEAAIRENTVELGIKGSLSQRGIDAKIETV